MFILLRAAKSHESLFTFLAEHVVNETSNMTIHWDDETMKLLKLDALQTKLNRNFVFNSLLGADDVV